MKLYAIADLHLAYTANRRALHELPRYPDDWLIVAGDVGETETHLRLALGLLSERFARVIWVPGNHELWTRPDEGSALRGEARYLRMVEICRECGVATPEDPYLRWGAGNDRVTIAPVFLLYDYSFCPPGMTAAEAVRWAAESGVVCLDEAVLHPDPYPTRGEWCAARCRTTRARLAEVASQGPIVLVNHFPMLSEHVRLPTIPRFSVWCGTTRTADWHRRFPIRVVVHGHLHVRSTIIQDNVRFEEVSLGYPRHWRQEMGMAAYLRQILPPPEVSAAAGGGC